jgi:SNF2 family DNA or RNA helicase
MERWGLGACLADDMGLGKTIQLIAFLLHQQEEEVLEAADVAGLPDIGIG